MAWTDIENTGTGEYDIINNYQLDLSKLANHGDACIIGGKSNNTNNTNSYFYGKWAFDAYPSESGTDYWAIARDEQNGIIAILEPSIQTPNGAEMNGNNSYSNSTQWYESESNGPLFDPVIVLNDNGIIRIIKDEETLNSFLNRYPETQPQPI